MIDIAQEVEVFNKPLFIDPDYYIADHCARGMVEVSQSEFNSFLNGVNYRSDLVGGIRRHHLVSNGKLVAFRVNGRKFIERTGVGI